MNWFVGTATYVVIWWLTIFAVLPWGVKPQADREAGNDAGAPANPRLGLKAAITTVVAGIIWAFVYWAVTHDLISFRDLT